MTRAELRELVSVWLDDINNGYFTVAQINVWLNDAQRTVQKKLIKCGQNYYFKPVQTTTVVSQQDYVLPQDFKKLNRLEVVVTGTGTNETRSPVIPITPGQSDFVNLGPALPEYYYLKKSRISLWPVPDNTYVLRLYYTYEVTDMTLDTDLPDVPESYVEYIACLAAMDGFIRDGRSSALLESKISFFDQLLQQDAQERMVDQPRSINITDPDGYGGYIF